jgi:hypothetical protein
MSSLLVLFSSLSVSWKLLGVVLIIKTEAGCCGIGETDEVGIAGVGKEADWRAIGETEEAGIAVVGRGAGWRGVWLPMALTGRICHDAQYRDT